MAVEEEEKADASEIKVVTAASPDGEPRNCGSTNLLFRKRPSKAAGVFAVVDKCESSRLGRVRVEHVKYRRKWSAFRLSLGMAKFPVYGG